MQTQKYLVGLLLFLSLSISVQAQQEGYLMSRACPFSCKTEGIDKRVCKDWRRGNTCYVEDLSRAPNNQTGPSQQPHNRPANRPPNVGYSPWGGGNNNNGDWENSECKSGSYISRPRVTIYKSKTTGNFFGEKLKVRGEVEGICLGEAGYFEAGRKKQNIPVTTTRSFRRYEFEIVVKPSEQAEIRVYNVNGDIDSIAIHPDGGSFGNW